MFATVGAGNDFGGNLGIDDSKGEHLVLDVMDSVTEGKAIMLKQMSIVEIHAAKNQSMKVFKAYIEIMTRYDMLKSSIDILRDKNTSLLQVVKEIERMYDEATDPNNIDYDWTKASKAFKQFTDKLPQETWVA